MKDERPILVCSALGEEIRPLLERLEKGRRLGGGWCEGELDGRRVLLGATGDGATRAEARLRRGLAATPCRAVLGIGFAGGLDPRLERGQIVVADEVGSPEGRVLGAASTWAALVGTRLGAPRGRLLSAGRLVPDAAAKASLHGERGPALTVDLESFAWAQVASELGCPWLVVRVVFDDAGDAVPDYILEAQDLEGRVDRLRLVVGALRRPARLKALLRLGRASKRLSAELAQAARTALAAFEAA